SNRRLDPVEGLARVGRSSAEHILAVKASAIGVLKKPHAHGAARWIVQMRFSIDFEEYLLRDVLRLSIVAKDVGRDSMDQPYVSTQQRSQRVAVWQVHFSDQVGVRLLIAGSAPASIGVAFHRSDP